MRFLGWKEVVSIKIRQSDWLIPCSFIVFSDPVSRSDSGRVRQAMVCTNKLSTSTSSPASSSPSSANTPISSQPHTQQYAELLLTDLCREHAKLGTPLQGHERVGILLVQGLVKHAITTALSSESHAPKPTGEGVGLV